MLPVPLLFDGRHLLAFIFTKEVQLLKHLQGKDVWSWNTLQVFMVWWLWLSWRTVLLSFAELATAQTAASAEIKTIQKQHKSAYLPYNPPYVWIDLSFLHKRQSTVAAQRGKPELGHLMVIKFSSQLLKSVIVWWHRCSKGITGVIFQPRCALLVVFSLR